VQEVNESWSPKAQSAKALFKQRISEWNAILRETRSMDEAREIEEEISRYERALARLERPEPENTDAHVLRIAFNRAADRGRLSELEIAILDLATDAGPTQADVVAACRYLFDIAHSARLAYVPRAQRNE
jgi:rRNA maturation endonuclease Nob1